MPNCDIKTGLCETSSLEKYSALDLNFTKPTIVYVGDPMCSWCYGVAPELEKLQSFAKEQNIGYKVMVGGLRPHGQEWNEEFKKFLAHHWQEVSLKSKKEFSYEFFKRENFNYTTLPSCKAVVAMRHLLKLNDKSEEELSAYVSDIQIAFFAQSLDPTDTNTLAKLAQNYHIKQDIFLQTFNDEKMEEATFAEFSQVQSLGVRGFPSVILFKDEKPMLVVSGYATASDMIGKVKSLLG